jgi:hypothetical protein
LTILDKLEENIIAGHEKAYNTQLLCDLTRAYHQNECSLLATMRFMTELQTDVVSFNIIDGLNYLMDLYNVQATQKAVELNLKIEPCFPKELTGEKRKCDLLLSAILSYFLSRCDRGHRICLEARMKQATNEEFLLTFEVSCTMNENVTLGNLRRALNLEAGANEASILLHDVSEKYGLPLPHCTHLVHWLKGRIEVLEIPPGRLGVEIELPFANYDSAKEWVATRALKIHDIEKVSGYELRFGHALAPRKVPDNRVPKRSTPIEPATSLAQVAFKPGHNPAKDNSKEAILQWLRDKNVTLVPNLCSKRRSSPIPLAGRFRR